MDQIVDSFRAGLFAGKRVLVSGGSSGIGLAVAEGFARAGAEVIATGTSDQKLQADRADSAKPGIRFEKLDVRNTAEIAAFVRADPIVPAYGASKTGVIGLTRHLAHAFGRTASGSTPWHPAITRPT
jgi:NAD(P)-dependent dehydrogenase (short-subunit alcohol dehydrogenase family)